MKTLPAKDLRTESDVLIRHIKKEKATLLTDTRGNPAAYLVAPETFDKLQSRLELLEGIVAGEKAIREGRVLSHAQARKKLGRWLKK